MKKIILIWDFDGPIGQINSTYPYNFNFKNFQTEIDNVKAILELLDEYAIKTCFAVTGFSAEEGIYPYNFPELINDISSRGHEIASHSWRHEWIPIFKKEQVSRSLKRSKLILEKTLNGNKEVNGFVPPHNRPMSWFRKGAISFGDRGLFPFFKMGDNGKLIKLLKQNNYKWIRISHKNIFQKLKFSKKNMTGRIYSYKGMLILENHYNGFGTKLADHILKTNFKTYTISAHPLMFSFENKLESKENFEVLIKKIKESNQKIEFITPSELL